MRRILIWITLIVAQVVLLIFFLDPDHEAFWAVVGILGGICFPVVDVFAHDWLRLRALFYSITRCTGRTRLSISYLFRIQVDNQYLLVKSSRWGHFQPVGGVYKFYESGRAEIEKLGYQPDELVKADEVSRRDLRLSVPGWRVSSMINWFVSGRDREIGGWREFHEELLATGILPADDFSSIDYRWTERRRSKLRHPEQGKLREILISDIFVLIPTVSQEAALRSLMADPPPQVLWATAERIRSRGAEPGQNLSHPISEHASLILA